MTEYTILLKDGTEDIIIGTSWNRAVAKSPYEEEEIEACLYAEYVD